MSTAPPLPNRYQKGKLRRGFIEIVNEVPLPYKTQQELELADAYGIRSFECRGTCLVKSCQREITPCLTCGRCTAKQMCKYHYGHRYRCTQCFADMTAEK